MNNNRGNNRRRGRGNNRSQGGNPVNRIDSRARGNAPQLLEKFRKLAHDSSLNGDRVQAEYYLQFADHYFRVIADSRAVKDDGRVRRDSERDGEGYDDDRDWDRGRRNSEERPDEDREDERDEGADADGGNEFEPPENPFTRDRRPARNTRERGNRRGRSDEAEAQVNGNSEGEATLDIAVLPPAIERPAIDETSEDAEDAPRPRRRTRRPRTDTPESGEALQKV